MREFKPKQTAMRGALLPTGALGPMNTLTRARIVGVLFRDDPGNKAGVTLVDVQLSNFEGNLFRVPLLHTKINKNNGEDQTPEVGDYVAVTFLDGHRTDPVVVGYLPPQNKGEDSEIECPTSAEAPQSFRRMQKTWEKIDKDGNRELYVEGYEVIQIHGEAEVYCDKSLYVEVQDNVNVLVKEGHLVAQVAKGDAVATVDDGDLFAYAKGTVDIEAGGDMHLKAPTTTIDTTQTHNGNVTINGDLQVNGKITSTGDITGGAKGVFTLAVTAMGGLMSMAAGGISAGAGHISDPSGTMADSRSIYNSHTHVAPGSGGETTTPDPTM